MPKSSYFENLIKYENMKNYITYSKLQNYIFVNIDRYKIFADGRITQYMHQIACIYIVVPQQKWNETYLEATYKLERGNIANFCFDEKLNTTNSFRELEFLSSFK